MTEQLGVLITLLLYILFFAWIGYQRGSKREAVVAVTAVIAWLVLQEGGDIFVRIINLGSKAVAFVRAGGLGANPDAAFGAIGDAPPWVTAEQRDEFLFIVWVIVLLLAYMVSNLKPFAQGSKSDGWSILLGIFNGLLFAAILLPKLVTIVTPAVNEAGEIEPIGIANLLGVLRGGGRLVKESLGGLWSVFDSGQRSLLLLALLTLFLLLAASTLRSSKKPQPSSAEKRS